MRFFALALVAVSMTACYQDQTVEPLPPGPCDLDTVYFSSNVYDEIINPNCNTSGCHNSTDLAGGYSFETYDQISTNAATINDVINHNGGFIPMPYGMPKLADSLIQDFNCWIEQGLKDN